MGIYLVMMQTPVMSLEMTTHLMSQFSHLFQQLIWTFVEKLVLLLLTLHLQKHLEYQIFKLKERIRPSPDLWKLLKLVNLYKLFFFCKSNDWLIKWYRFVCDFSAWVRWIVNDDLTSILAFSIKSLSMLLHCFLNQLKFIIGVFSLWFF